MLQLTPTIPSFWYLLWYVLELTVRLCAVGTENCGANTNFVTELNSHYQWFCCILTSVPLTLSSSILYLHLNEGLFNKTKKHIFY